MTRELHRSMVAVGAMTRLIETAQKRGDVVAINTYNHARLVHMGRIALTTGNPTISVDRDAMECPSCRERQVRYDTATGDWYCRNCGDDGATGTYWQRLGEAYKPKQEQETK